MRSKSLAVLALVGLGLLTGPAAAVTEAQKCEATKLKRAGQYNFCRLKAKGKAVKTGELADYSRCDTKLAEKWAAAEAIPMCPTTEDATAIQAQVATDADSIALKLGGVRFVDNGDGTVTDVQSGLMWEKKDDLGGIHDKDSDYTWSATGTLPDGTVFTSFLGTLNNATSPDGTTISACFANHCDWRLPTIVELQTILLEPFPCATNPCIDPIFGASQGVGQWSSIATSGPSLDAWLVSFFDGAVVSGDKTGTDFVRAVRGGL